LDFWPIFFASSIETAVSSHEVSIDKIFIYVSGIGSRSRVFFC
jgi:hypothetical protein